MPARLSYKAILEYGAPPIGGKLTGEATLDFLLEPVPIVHNMATRTFQIVGTAEYHYTHLGNCQPSGTLSGAITVDTLVARSSDNYRDILTVPFFEKSLESYSSVCLEYLSDGTTMEYYGYAPSPYSVLSGIQGEYDVSNGFSKSESYGYDFQWSRGLSLACDVKRGPVDALPLRVWPPEGEIWPKTIDHSKTSVEIASLKQVPIGLNLGLTQFQVGSIKPEISWLGEPAAFGGGHCFHAEALSIKAGKIYIYISNKYQVGSCEYEATLRHEHKHYDRISVILREHFAYLREQLSGNMSTGWKIPTQGRPAYATSFDRGTTQGDAVIKRLIEVWKETLVERLKIENAMLEQETQTVLNQCQNW